MKLALVHEHLANDGGAEKVLLAFQQTFPDAPTFTLLFNRAVANSAFSNKDIRTSFLQKMPFAMTKYVWYLWLMPLAIERFDFRGYDVVLSSASGFAKGVLTSPDTVHLCYCHSPTRYLWTDSFDYVNALPYPRLMKAYIASYLSKLRAWDRLAADRVDHFIANSETVRRRIQKYYRRDATVIYPPVDVGKFSVAERHESFYLTGGRLVPYKRFDLTVQAFTRLRMPLKVFGAGPELARLKAMAGPTVEFLGKVPDTELRTLMSKAAAFVHPQEEDFGITPVESMASGRPVIAFHKGGAAETVVDGKTGVFFDEQSWEALSDAVIRFKPDDYDPAAIRGHAEQFSGDRFAAAIRAFINKHAGTLAQQGAALTKKRNPIG